MSNIPLGVLAYFATWGIRIFEALYYDFLCEPVLIYLNVYYSQTELKRFGIDIGPEVVL